jgi:hypothetical protein
MCQMCDEYEHELVRMGLIEDARKFRAEREREHEAAVSARNAAQETSGGVDKKTELKGVAHKARAN